MLVIHFLLADNVKLVFVHILDGLDDEACLLVLYFTPFHLLFSLLNKFLLLELKNNFVARTVV